MVICTQKSLKGKAGPGEDKREKDNMTINMGDNRPETHADQVMLENDGADEVKTVSDEELKRISDELIKRNHRVYEELAK